MAKNSVLAEVTFNRGADHFTKTSSNKTNWKKKDRDKRLIKNWHPISLLNVDSKLISKSPPNRIQDVMPNLKLVSAIFYQIFIFSSHDSPSKTMKNVFYFI